jgi:hypothetical protein
MTHRLTPDIKGQRFGRLTARAEDPKNPKPGMHWWFYCRCGQYRSIRATNVISGRTKSCGCLKKDYIGRLRADLTETAKLQKALDIAMEFMAQPGMYRASDNTVKAINEVLHGKTGE